jgi:uncharacterized protein (TIGR03790 family)
MNSHSFDRFYNSLASSHLIYLILAGINLAASVVLRAQVTGVEKSVVVIYNSAMPESKSVANHYADIRNIPENQLIGLELSKEETISRKDFNETLHDPLFQIFKDREFFNTDYEIVPATRERPGTVYQNLQKSKIRYLVLCYGVPVRVEGDPTLHEDATESMRVELRFNGAAVDHEPCVGRPYRKPALCHAKSHGSPSGERRHDCQPTGRTDSGDSQRAR